MTNLDTTSVGPTSLGALADTMGMRIVELTRSRCVMTMPVAGNTQPYGLLHGGASGVLIETAGSFAAHLHAEPGFYAVGVELNVSHHRSARSGVVTVTANVLHAGRRSASFGAQVHDEDGNLIASGRLLCMMVPQAGPALDPARGTATN